MTGLKNGPRNSLSRKIAPAARKVVGVEWHCKRSQKPFRARKSGKPNANIPLAVSPEQRLQDGRAHVAEARARTEVGRALTLLRGLHE